VLHFHCPPPTFPLPYVASQGHASLRYTRTARPPRRRAPSTYCTVPLRTVLRHSIQKRPLGGHGPDEARNRARQQGFTPPAPLAGRSRPRRLSVADGCAQSSVRQAVIYSRCHHSSIRLTHSVSRTRTGPALENGPVQRMRAAPRNEQWVLYLLQLNKDEKLTPNVYLSH